MDIWTFMYMIYDCWMLSWMLFPICVIAIFVVSFMYGGRTIKGMMDWVETNVLR